MPWPNQIWMDETEGYRFIVVTGERPDNYVYTKKDSCYVQCTPNKHGLSIDYRTKEKAQWWANRLNESNSEGNYSVKEIK